MKPAKNIKIELTPRQARALLNLIQSTPITFDSGIDVVDVFKAQQTINAAFAQ